MRPPRLRRALVRGERAAFWHYYDDLYILLHPNGMDETDVPMEDTRDPDAMLGHYARLGATRWVSAGAIDELREIVAGARR